MNQTDVMVAEETVGPVADPVGVVVGDSLRVRVASVIVLAIVACLAVWHGWERGMVLAPTDGLQLVAPWAKPGAEYVARNEQLLDQTVQFVPWTIYTVERYRAGQVPLWNPYSQLGVPFLANGQSAVFYPTVLLHLKLPETWSWTISAAARLFIAGLGLYVLAGRYRVRGVARLLAAVAFMLCGFNVVWMNHPQMNVMPWLPWAVWIVEGLMERVTLRRFLGGALVFAVQFLGGHPATCIHLLVTCGLVVGWRVVVGGEDPRRAGGYVSAEARMVGLLAVGGVVALGFALAAAQWLPLLEYAEHSGAAVVRKEKLAHARAIELSPAYLVGVAFPYANGFPDGVAPFEMRRVTHLPNTNELAPGFVGTIPLVLALFAMLLMQRRRIVRMWTIIGAVAALIAIRFPGVDQVVRHVPGLNVAQNARLLGVTAMALALLAGMGLEVVTEALRRGVDLVGTRRTLAVAAVVLALVATVGGLGLLIGKNAILRGGYAKAEREYKTSTVHEHTLEQVKGVVDRVHAELVFTCTRLLIPAGMLGAAAWMLWRRPRWAMSAVPWFGLAAVDLLAFAVPYNPGAPAETYFPAGVPAIARLKELPPARFAGTFRTMPPETSTAYGLADLRGYDALAPERYYRWWAHPGIGELAESQQGYLARLENPEHPAWSLLNFGYLMGRPDQGAPEGGFKAIEAGEDAIVYQAPKVRLRAWVAARAQTLPTAAAVLDRVAKMDFNPDEVVLLDEDIPNSLKNEVKPGDWANTAFGAGGTSVQFLPPAKGEEERPEVVRLRVTGASGGYLVLADTYFPGWEASVVDERTGVGRDVPILPAYGVMRAVPLPAERAGGAVVVEMRYRPLSWRIGAMVSASAVALFAVLLGLSLIPSRSGDPV